MSIGHHWAWFIVVLVVSCMGGTQVMGQDTTTETKLKVGDNYHGFILKEIRELTDINSTGLYFIHEQTGARLLKLECADDNQAFTITFKTLPASDNGIAHVTEHSVLNGSRKYPVKSPFEILNMGSFATFLNAATMADHTSYPIASRNRKDFFNLMDVYLDAVFYPNLKNEPKILMQEGWHYQLEEAGAPLEYNGIVYNEMKGALSSPESVLWSKVPKLLLPDTIYAHESGGVPESIPELTQSEFVAFHDKYYHPSNSYIYLYGNGDTLEELAFLNDGFLKDFDKREIAAEIKLQTPFDEMKQASYEYPIMGEVDEADKSILSLTFVLKHDQDQIEQMAIELLAQVLESSSSPLRQALNQTGLGKDMSVGIYGGMRQPLFSFILKNANPTDKDKFIELVYSTLRTMVEQGIDKLVLESLLNSSEFDLREANFGGFPKGLVYNFITSTTWLHRDDPFIALQFDPVLKKLRSMLETDYFERLLQTSILDNKHRGFVLITPKKDLEIEREKALAEKLTQIKASMTPEEIERTVQQTRALQEYQMTPDSPENIAKVPLLTLADINPKADAYEVVVKKMDELTLLHYPDVTNDITYVRFMFDTTGVPQDLIPYISLLAEVMGELNTKNKSYTDLETEIKLHTGGIAFSHELLIRDDDPFKIKPLFVVQSKCLTPKIKQNFELQAEIIGQTIFNDTARLKEILRRLHSRWESRLNWRGIGLAVTRLSSHLTPYGAYQELTDGLSFFKFIAALDQNFDNRAEDTARKLEQVAGLIFNRENLIVGVTAPEADYAQCQELLPVFLNSLGQNSHPRQSYTFDLKPLNEGLLSISKVNYVVKGNNYKKLGYSYSGALELLEHILTMDYLTSRIRVQGGAYGAFAILARSGFAAFSSYRDPNLVETLKNYDDVVSFLNELEISERDLTRFIIGKIADLDQPLTPPMKGRRAIDYYLQGTKYDDLQKERTEILNTSLEDLKALAPMMADIFKTGQVVVLGNESQIKAATGTFDALVPVIE
ncbi:insulinase family protein [bacterium]|nr:insulinase family protein [bacterium]